MIPSDAIVLDAKGSTVFVIEDGLAHQVPVNTGLTEGLQTEITKGLKAGQIISTGTCTGLIGVKPGDTAVCDFGGLGAVEIQFTEAAR